jgi:hypothetical protein
MLLNLNAQTFIGYNGAVLAYEVRKARMQGLPLVLVHECDPLRDGCGFDRFLQSTPQDLINTGLYRRLAVPLQPGAHRVISIHLLARELGASKISGRLRRKLSDSSSTIRHGVSMVASTMSPRNAKGASYCANPAASPSMPVISISAAERPGECSASPNGSRRRATAHFQVDFDRAPAMPRASARAYPTTIVGTRLEGVPTTIVGTRIEQPTRMAEQASAEMASEQGYPGQPRTYPGEPRTYSLNALDGFDGLEQLVGMGFTRHEAAAALSKHGGSVRAAAYELLNGDGSTGTHRNSPQRARRLSALISESI